MVRGPEPLTSRPHPPGDDPRPRSQRGGGKRKVGGLSHLLSLAHYDIFVFWKKKKQGVGLDATGTML